jgi:membrane fusion protein, copper/silver efflux system
MMKMALLKYNFLTGILLVFFSAFLFSCNAGKKKAAEQTKPKEVWTCSMHPEVIRDGPGSCPICGMDLIKKEEKAVALKGIELSDLLQPSDQFVVSSIPVVTLQNEKKSLPVEVLGSVNYDSRHINMISARVSGRIEKLYVRYRYQHIHKGDRIMDIYSPELATAQQELLFLIKNDPENERLIRTATQKLLLLGMSEDQLNKVISSNKPSATITVYSNYSGHLHEAGNSMPVITRTIEKTDASASMEELPVKEGTYVQQGQNIFQLFNTDNVWVLLNIFPESQAIVKVGDPVKIIPETNPTMSLNGKIDFIEPVYRPDSKTLTARVYLKNSMGTMSIGSQVRARIFTAKVLTSWLPKDAVLFLGVDKVVFLKTSGGFLAHKVVTGLIYKDQIQIVSGLNETDSVAANGQFLADSESFIKIKK